KNSTPRSAIIICIGIGILPVLSGPIKDNVSGNNSGCITKSIQIGNKNMEAKTAVIRIQRVNVPVIGVCLYSSACSIWSKYVIGKIMTLGDVSTNKTTYPLRSEEHTSELQSRFDLVCRLLLE